jgi:hypothetical protein
MTEEDLWIDGPDELARAAAGPTKRKAEPFVQVPLWWIERMTRATGTARAFVGLWLLYLAWKTKSNKVTLPNGQLEARGVSRKVKSRALRQLEAAGLIKVSRRKYKTPTVTLLHL